MGKPKFERREIEIRAIGEEEMVVEGYAIVFNSPATHERWGDKFTETICKGALDNTDMKDVPLRYNHNDSVMIMARTRNKSLELNVDDKGLLIRATLIDTQANRDLYKSIQEGLIDKMSFAFTVADGGARWEFEEGEEREDKRFVTNIDKLYDVSVVDVPFYDSTSIYARSFELLDSEKESRLDEARAFEIEKEKLKLKHQFR